ncbi:MAG: response regulator [Candidatus Aenigmarchaeota archaeon]|nr:response regulator [Candidatus Aenigmarchaeota archaeon]
MGAKTKILLAEDDIQLVDMYRRKFDLEGFETIIAEDGEETLKALETSKPDIILLDIMMPKVDGLQVLKKIRENPETKNIIVVVLTNLGSEATAAEIFKLGADDYIVKADFTPLEVANKVKELLAERKKK